MDWQESLKNLLDTADLPAGEEIAAPAAPARKPDKLLVTVERKGRGGKVATIVSGFSGSDSEVAPVAASLKKKLGAGGSARGGEILIQGDRSADVRRVLSDMGYRL